MGAPQSRGWTMGWRWASTSQPGAWSDSSVRSVSAADSLIADHELVEVSRRPQVDSGGGTPRRMPIRMNEQGWAGWLGKRIQSAYRPTSCTRRGGNKQTNKPPARANGPGGPGGTGRTDARHARGQHEAARCAEAYLPNRGSSVSPNEEQQQRRPSRGPTHLCVASRRRRSAVASPTRPQPDTPHTRPPARWAWPSPTRGPSPP